MDGTPFGRYRLTEQLGQGGMGEVWRAHDTELDRVVAIKMLLPHFAQDPKFEERFRREARAAARLDDPHVVPIYDVGQIDGRLYVSMRLITGQDLQTLLEAGPLDPHRAVAIIAQIAQALHAAHDVGLVHRDIKPSNILVAQHDFAYLIDFGIARAAGEIGLTSTGATIGTWSYMSPERFSTGLTEPSSDIYALACVLYQCLTGELPFPAVALEQIAVAHMTAPPPRPSTQQPAIPPAMDEVIANGLAKDPTHRYPTTSDLASAARDALSVSIRPASPAAPAQPTASASPPTPVLERTSRPVPPPQPATLAAVHANPTLPPSPVSAPAATRQAAPKRVPSAAPPSVSLPGSPSPQARWHTKTVLIAVAVFIAAIITVTAILLIPENDTKAPKAVSYGAQVALPFTGIDDPWGMAVDTSGAVTVTSTGNSPERVYKLLAGSDSPAALPFPGIIHPGGVAVDSSGAVYVTDGGNNRVLKLAAGSTTPVALSFPELAGPWGVAVDSSGTLYVTDGGNKRVLKLAAGSTTPDVLPFTGLTHPNGVAVDSSGAVYVTDYTDNRVLKLAAGSTTPVVLPFTGLTHPEGVVVDKSGAVYLGDNWNNRVLKLAAGSTTPDVLPFIGIRGPKGVALDSSGAVYVADAGNNRVLKLPTR